MEEEGDDEFEEEEDGDDVVDGKEEVLEVGGTVSVEGSTAVVR